jgi:hypothetical protein
MSRICTVCAHASRRAIDVAIVSGKSNRIIASQFRVTRAAVQRHKQHVAAALERASEKRTVSIGESILNRLEDLYQRGLGLLNSTERAKNHSASIGYLRELRGILSGLYEVSRAVVPKYAQQPPMPAEYIAAISRALGVSEFVPIDNRALATLPSGNGSGGDVIDVDLDILPE